MLSTRNQEEKSVLPDMPRPGTSTVSENRLAIARAGGRKERGAAASGHGVPLREVKTPWKQTVGNG